jgi:tetratricopeptide (TPR) repeat protein
MNKIDMKAELFVKRSEEIIPISDMDAEKMKNAVLSAQDIDGVMALLEDGMILKFTKAGRSEEIVEIIDELHGKSFMEPGKINLYLKQGSVYESVLDFSMAAIHYYLGIEEYAMKVKTDNRHSYWLFNNCSFCRDFQERFPEAQKLAEKAISIDSTRHNAWKNLGVSFEHQNRYVEAAACYMASFIKCGGGGGDPRPMMHLERIFKRHDKLKDALADQAKKEIGKIYAGPFKNFSLAETYYYCGHFDKAMYHYKKFYAVAPSGYASHLSYICRRLKELNELKQIEAQFK